MKVEMYGVKDTVVGTFMQPFCQRNNAEALRSFKFDIEKNGDNIANLSDLQLYHLGSFDDESGELVPHFEFLVNAIDFKKVEKVEVIDNGVL